MSRRSTLSAVLALSVLAQPGATQSTEPAPVQPGDILQVQVDHEGTPDDGLIIRADVHGARAAFADNFPDRGRSWFPSIDHPSDRATVEYEIRAPSGWEVVANGRRAGSGDSETQPADGVWRWRMEVPIPTYTMSSVRRTSHDT